MLVLTLAIAGMGALIGKKLKIPAGVMVGAIVSVAIVNLLVGVPAVPMFLKWLTQVIAGAFIGVGLNRDCIQRLRKFVKPACIILCGLLSINILLGLALYHLSSMDLCTALFATVPGGLTEMSVISEEMGADTALVSVFQLARMTVTVCVFPFFITRIMKARKAEKETVVLKKKTSLAELSGKEWMELLFTLFFAGAAGVLGRLSGFPGGVLLFSAVAVSFLQIRFGIGLLPQQVKRLAQVIVGSYIGAKLTSDVVRSVAKVWPYIVMIVGIYLIFCIVMGSVLARVTEVDKLTAAFSCAPAGASDMALIASDFDVEPTTIAVLQMIRLIMVIAICPGLITLLLKLQSVIPF